MSTPKDIRLSNYEMARNFLSGISNPQNYVCSVLGYVRGHSQMYVKAESISPETDKSLILGFESVWYFEGPMRWKGLDFRLGSLDERINFLQGEWLNVGDWLNEFAEKHLLFVFERPKYKVQIFSGSFYVSETEPRIHISYPDLPQQNQP